MKWIYLLVVLCLGQGIFYVEAASEDAAKKAESKVEFNPVSDIEQRRDTLQRDRFLKRQDVIEALLKKIQSAWSTGEEKVLETEIPILGDECMNLFSIADLPEKEVKKLKRKGYKINSRCESLLSKIQDGNYSEHENKWSKIKAEAELLLKQSKGL